MRRLTLAASVLVVALGLSLPAGAPAGSSAAPQLPLITKVVKMRVGVGQTITVYGRNFSSRRTRNTVIFRAPNGRSVFSTPRRASTGKLVLHVPASISRLLSRTSGSNMPTRFRLHVLSSRRVGRLTPKRLSPVVVETEGIDDAARQPATMPTG